MYTAETLADMDTEYLMYLRGSIAEQVRQVRRDHAANFHLIGVCLHDTSDYAADITAINAEIVKRAANGAPLAAAYVVADRDAYLASLPKCVTCHDPIQVGAKWCEIHSPQDD